MNTINQINRRHFLKNSFLTSAALSLPVHSWAQVKGSSDDIRVAIVGFNGQGKGDLEEFRKVPGVRVVALCDVDKEVLEREAKKFKDRNEPIETYTDVRKLLENKNIDAISTATPNHWHALISIWAMQAGKDVYVQKPVSHNVSEGRRMVEAARKYKKIVQAGTQSRSSSGLREAVEWVRAGNIGKIIVSRGICYKPRVSIGKVTMPLQIPATIDYDLWCGPAAKVPIMRSKLHYDWHWIWNTGNGDLGNQGVHEMDVARWFLGEMELPPRTFAVGGRFGYIDDGETPNTMVIYHDYAEAPLLFELRGLPEKAGAKDMDKYKGTKIGVVVECEGGYVVVSSYSKATAFDKDGKELKQFEGSENHKISFIKAMRSRKTSDLTADILEGHLSSALCHTGNISYRLGKTSSRDEITDAVKNQKKVGETLARVEQHLAANLVDFQQTPAKLGVVLNINPKTERFVDNEEANHLLTREYRKPFVVPEKV
ncbi:MAG: Gfo/Idh/MocA family oxidoreductase [Verrucomicrobiota bacterium]